MSELAGSSRQHDQPEGQRSDLSTVRVLVLGTLVVEHDGRAALPCKDLVQSMVDEMAEDARHLRCEAELRRVRALLDEGTSAHEQLSLYLQARARGDSRVKALHAVVDWLIDATVPSP